MLGMSTYVGKKQVKEFLGLYLKPGMKICDMGAGGGTYYDLLGPGYEWTAVEIWTESVKHLQNLYDHVYQVDIRDFEYPEFYDLIIFGDVLEHLDVKDAQTALKKAEAHSAAIMVAIPYNYPQNAIDGNEAEIHLQADLTPEIFNERYPNFGVIFKTDKLAYYWKES